jgi:membrane protease YdiL (CAAX protease family)
VEESTPSPPQLPSSPPLDPRGVATIATMIVFALFLGAGLIVQPLNVAFGIWFTQLFVFLGFGWFVLRATGREPVRYTGLAFPGMGPAVFGFVLGVVNFFAIVVPVQYVSQVLLPESWQQIYDVRQLFRGQAPVELGLIIAGVGLAAPVCEEFFFRGVFLQGLRTPPWTPEKAIVVTAVVFSVFHLDPVGFLARVELGVLFGWLVVRTGSLWPSILAHAANNLVSTVLFFTAKELSPEKQQAAAHGAELLAVLMFASLGVVALWGLLALGRRYPDLLLRSHRPAEVEWRPARLEPLPRLARFALPWSLAAVLSLGAYVALDPRGIQLSQFDLRHPLEPLPEDAPPALEAEREYLYQLRVKARQGEIPLGEYMEERARQSRQQTQMNR